MLSISSTFLDIEKAHKEESKSIKVIAREMGVGENKLRRLLIAAGYEYDSSLKIWRYVLLDESKDKRNMSFWAFDEKLKNGTNSNKGNNHITEKGNKNITHNTHKSNTSNNIFSEIEIEALKSIAKSYISNTKINIGNTSNNETIIDRIAQLKTGTPQKKTFSIDAGIISQLDKFCETNRIKKSDALAVAIEELLARYN